MKPFPVLFAGHGSPMNALADNGFTRALTALGRALPRPKAVIAVSAHWYGDGLKVQASAHPKTIHDFGGFPRELYEIEYPAPGDPALARALGDALAPQGAILTEDWGLDHGAWSVLRHLFPKADVPVVQLSIDRRRSFEEHDGLGQKLAAFRAQGVLILGSGGITHNLGKLQAPGAETPAWAGDFDRAVATAIEGDDREALVEPARLPGAALSVPTPDHYLPLVYARAAAAGDKASFPVTGFEHGSLSLRSVLWGSV